MNVETDCDYVGSRKKLKTFVVRWGTCGEGVWATLVRASQVRYVFTIWNHGPNTILQLILTPYTTEFWCDDYKYREFAEGKPIWNLAKGIFHAVGPVEPLLDELMTRFPRAEPFVQRFLSEVV